MSFRVTKTYRNLNAIVSERIMDARATVRVMAATLGQRVLSAEDLFMSSFPTEVGNLINGAMINQEMIN